MCKRAEKAKAASGESTSLDEPHNDNAPDGLAAHLSRFTCTLSGWLTCTLHLGKAQLPTESAKLRRGRPSTSRIWLPPPELSPHITQKIPRSPPQRVRSSASTSGRETAQQAQLLRIERPATPLLSLMPIGERLYTRLWRGVVSPSPRPPTRMFLLRIRGLFGRQTKNTNEKHQVRGGRDAAADRSF